MEEFTIKNWNVFSTYWVSVEVYKIEKDGKDIYNPTITFSLDDFTIEKMPDVEAQKVLSISSDRFFTDGKIAAMFMVQHIKDIFYKLSSKVFVYDQNHNLLEEYDINEFIEEEV